MPQINTRSIACYNYNKLYTINKIKIIPPALIVALLAALPVLELRGAIPVGKILGLPMEANFFWAVIGNMLPIFIILKVLDPVSKWLMRHSNWCNRAMTKLFAKTRVKHTKKFEKTGAACLIAFVAIPFPGTGAWTGALIAYLFNIPYWKAILLIFFGVLGAAIIVSMTMESVTQLPALVRFLIK
jgi:uncharacterized membrane protein